ncbi:MAG: hypothetical protein JXQ73_04270 [Phycisphaerae bacterium]|nr:hypothetical protein [Phycisphaerae bacterium]
MTRRQRVMAALNHEEPDRVPMDLGGSLASTMVGEAYPALRQALGLPAHEHADARRYASLADIEDDVREALDVDIVHGPQACGAGGTKEVISDDTFIDEWGVRWHKPPGGHYYVERAPFQDEATVQAVERYDWMEPKDMVMLDGVAETLRKLRKETDYAVTLEIRGRVLSLGQFLRGFENFMVDLAMNESFVQALFERTTQIQIAVNDIVFREIGDLVDIVYTSDDLGGQNGPQIGPDCFKRLLKPHFNKIWAHARVSTKAKLMHHCCGSCYAFIGDFIQLGVQAINPLQVSAAYMDTAKLKSEFGKRMAFWGGIDTQSIMPRGSAEDVRQEVKRRIHDMAPGGGYILSAVHNLQPEVPPANIIALFEAGKEFGRYPIAV